MTAGPSSLAELLRRLAPQLDDALLRRCFPEAAPADLRSRLLEAAALLAGQEAQPLDKKSGSPSEGAKPAKSAENSVSSRVRLFADGAARGNPGKAGAGVVLLDDQGKELVARGVYLGECTNNVAEYRALLLGLTEARQLGVRELGIYLDSELVVRQLQGKYQVKDTKLKPLHSQAQSLLQSFKSYRVFHVPRRENQRADFLANQGIDQRGSNK